MPDIKTVLADPDFAKVPFDEKRYVLSQLDSDFAKLGESDQFSVLKELGYERPAAPPLEYSGREGWITGPLKAVQNAGQNVARLLPENIPLGAAARTWPKVQVRPGPEAATYALTQAAGMMTPNAVIPRATGLIPRIGQEALETGTMSAVETGDWEQAKTGAAIGAGSAIAGATLAKVMDKWGSSIQLRKISPRNLDYQAGFDPDVVKKLNLKGNLRDNYKQISDEITSLAQKRAQLLQKTRGGTPITVNIQDTLDSVESQIRGQISSGSTFGRSNDVLNAFEELKKDIIENLGAGVISPNVSLEYAERAKESMGLVGDFVFNAATKGAKIPRDDAARTQVADLIYLQLKRQIEDSLPPGMVQALNNRMSQLIPIRRAILKQLPVDERQAAIQAMELWAAIPAILSGNPTHLGLLAAVTAQKHIPFGNWLVRNSESVKDILPRAGKVLTGLATGMTYDWTPSGGLIPVEEPPK